MNKFILEIRERKELFNVSHGTQLKKELVLMRLHLVEWNEPEPLPLVKRSFKTRFCRQNIPST